MKIFADTIIFDLDGTLINSGEDIANAVIHAMRELNAPLLTKPEIIGFIGLGVDYLIDKSFEGSDDYTKERAKKIYRDYYRENISVHTTLYPGIIETLQHFKNKKMAVFTNKPEDTTCALLKKFDIAKFMKIVIGPESVKEMKPSPEGILTILEKLSSDKESTLMVGDSFTDVLAGKKAGVMTCGVLYGLGSKEKLKNSVPQILIDNMEDLLNIIK